MRTEDLHLAKKKHSQKAFGCKSPRMLLGTITASQLIQKYPFKYLSHVNAYNSCPNHSLSTFNDGLIKP